MAELIFLPPNLFTPNWDLASSEFLLEFTVRHSWSLCRYYLNMVVPDGNYFFFVVQVGRAAGAVRWRLERASLLSTNR